MKSSCRVLSEISLQVESRPERAGDQNERSRRRRWCGRGIPAAASKRQVAILKPMLELCERFRILGDAEDAERFLPLPQTQQGDGGPGSSPAQLDTLGRGSILLWLQGNDPQQEVSQGVSRAAIFWRLSVQRRVEEAIQVRRDFTSEFGQPPLRILRDKHGQGAGSRAALVVLGVRGRAIFSSGSTRRRQLA